MSELHYIRNGLDGGQPLRDHIGKPIAFRSDEQARQYCQEMAIGLSLPDGTFSVTTHAPSAQAPDVA